MNHVQHITVGAIVSGVVYFILYKTQWISTELSGIDWILLALVVYIYSQLPDIDADVSIINKIWNTTAGIVGIYALYTGKYKALGLFAISSIVALEWIKHRGVTHEEWFGVIMAAPLWFFNPLFAIVGLVSYLSHILADKDFMR
jgi:hypothetical protein